MHPWPEVAISEWRPEADPAALEMLAEVLHAAVHAGASVSFILPFELDDARAFWREQVAPRIAAGSRRALIASHRDRIVGTVQLELAMPPNQAHRAEVLKLLVHPEARRQGIGRALMIAVEEIARAEGRTLLTLDTRTGDRAEPLYESLGYVCAGVIPNYARGPFKPDLEPATIMYKQLSEAS